MKKNKIIGFIGLGSMGLPMAKRLCKADYEVLTAVYRNHKSVKLIENMGATIKNSFDDVILNSDVIMTMLPADKQIKEVLLKENVINHIQSGKILIEMSTGSPSMIKEVAEIYQNLGVKVLDAPVSGGTSSAENGTLTIMIGGKERDVEEVVPILETISSRFLIVGEVGAGKAVKAINQMLVSVHVMASSEAILLAKHLNIDLKTLEEVIKTSSGSSWIFHNKFEKITFENFDLGFRLKLMLKDISIALNEGEELSLPMTKLALKYFQFAEKKYGDLDISAVSKMLNN